MGTISVSMIVKDEESNLDACIQCLLPILDELIVVDTGSKDRTKEIAAKYTDKIYDFVWTGDFSEARNYAFSLATMEYIYSADADERLDLENQEKFLFLKRAMLPEIEIVQMRYANQLEMGSVYNFDEEYRPKLFRRLRQFRWISPIHETVATAPLVFDSDIVIGHFPKEQHSQRDLAAFCRAAKAAQLDSRLFHMYAMELYIAGDNNDFLQAEDYFYSCTLDPERSLEEVQEARCVVARAARLRGDSESFFQQALLGVVDHPPAELCCEIGEFYLSRCAYQEACRWFFMAWESANSVLTIKASGSWAMSALVRCYEALDESDLAAHWQKRCDDWTPTSKD